MKNDLNIRGLIVPHAPTLLEDEMDQKPSQVIAALQDMGNRLKAWGIDTVVAATTHWQTADTFYVDDSKLHQTVTDYYGFRREIEYDVAGQTELAQLLVKKGQENLIYPKTYQHGADHAITVPLHFMFPHKEVPVVPLSISGSKLCAFRWGRTLRQAFKEWGRKVLFMASGSLAHDLRGFIYQQASPEHSLFDEKVLDLLKAGQGMDVLKMDSRLVQTAKPEGDFRDLFMLLGVMGSQSTGQVLAYEKLPGVGLGVVEFQDSGTSENDEVLVKDYQNKGWLQ